MLRGLSPRAKLPRRGPSAFMTCPILTRQRRRRRVLTVGVLIFSVVTLCLCYTRLFSDMSLVAQGFHPSNPPEEKPKGPKREDEAPKGKYKGFQADLPMSYGTNAHPPFKDLTQLGSVPAQYVPSATNHKRLIVVGDVHGMRTELEKLLEKVHFDGGINDHLVLAGDMVNKGPDSPGVVDLAMKYKASAVRGNHEDRVLLAKLGMMMMHVADASDGTGSDGEDPNDDKLEQQVFSRGDYEDRNTARSLSKKQLDWLASRPVILQAGPVGSLGHLVVVHAGLVPGVPLERQDPWAVMNMRSLTYPREELRRKEIQERLHNAARARTERGGRVVGPVVGRIAAETVEKEYQRRKKDNDRSIAMPVETHDGERWTDVWNAYQSRLPEEQRTTVVFGHDSKRGLNVGPYAFGIDSGCVRGGKLTALVIEGTESGVSHKIQYVQCTAAKGAA